MSGAEGVWTGPSPDGALGGAGSSIARWTATADRPRARGDLARGVIALAAAILLFATGRPAAAQIPDSAEVARLIALANPGPEHARLAELAGEWDVEVRFATGPDQAVTARAVATNRTILGGRFLVSESTALEPVMGQMVEGFTVYGFDRRAEAWTLVGFDTFGTYYVTAEGEAPPGAGTIVMAGSVTDPSSGRTETYEMELEIVSADEYVTRVVFQTPEGDIPAVEAVHRRRR